MASWVDATVDRPTLLKHFLDPFEVDSCQVGGKGQSQAYAQALQYAYAPNMLTAQQLTAAGLTSPGFPAYAAAAGPAPAGQPNPQQQPAEQRIQ